MFKIPSSSSEETEAQTGATTCPSQCQPLHPRTFLYRLPLAQVSQSQEALVLGETAGRKP